MADPRPVLDAIRAVLKFKDRATIAEVARFAELRQRHVLDVINANGELVQRDRKTGHITKVNPEAVLRQSLRDTGPFYFPGTYGAWSVEGNCLHFNGHDDLRQSLSESMLLGAFGDSYRQDIVLDTPENRAALEAAGLRLWSEVEVDDRLWKEGGATA
jgi:hypothetical protein